MLINLICFILKAPGKQEWWVEWWLPEVYINVLTRKTCGLELTWRKSLYRHNEGSQNEINLDYLGGP